LISFDHDPVAVANTVGVLHRVEARQQFHVTWHPAGPHKRDTAGLVIRAVFRPFSCKNALSSLFALQARFLAAPSCLSRSVAGFGNVQLGRTVGERSSDLESE
jgi:hypothetical protein